MVDAMEQQLKREKILSHYENPKNRGLFDDNSYIKVNMNNESCIDEIHLMVKIVDDKIVDIRFDGEACAICISAASIMIQILIGKTIEEVKMILDSYKNMINGHEYDVTVLEDAIVYADISRQPNRKTCALLPWLGIEKIVGEKGSE